MTVIPFSSDRDGLQLQLEALRKAVDELDSREPSDETSEEYELWSEEHEDLEDQIDDILDLLD